MASSIYVPVHTFPVSLEQLKEWLESAAVLFGGSEVRIDVSNEKGKIPFNESSLTVEGWVSGLECSLSFFSCSEEISEREGYFHMADIKTRGDWWFAGVVAYAVLVNSGYIVFDDSGRLGVKSAYTEESLRLILKKENAV